MNAEEAKGLMIFAGIWAVLAFTLAGCMERKLRRLNRRVREIHEDMTKYVN
jgi:hypothetical protein